MLGSRWISGFMYDRNKLKYTNGRKRKHNNSAQQNSCNTKYMNAKPVETLKRKGNQSMNNFDLEFLDGYIKSTIRMSKKTLKTSDLNEAKRMANDMEERAIQKLGESMAEL